MPTHFLRLNALAFVLMIATSLSAAPVSENTVTIVPNEASNRVDILIGGQPFTSYIWPDTLKKPVLFPLRTADGTVITRGWPMEPRAGERTDHPHHVGFWFNYENVNGVDFWNNSTALPAAQQAKMGRIEQERIVQAKSGERQGTLEVAADWIMPDQKPILHEDTEFIFRAAPGMRTVDRITTLTALDKPVVFKDSKDGLIGLRVRRELEQPETDAVTYTDASGRPTTVKAMSTNGVTGLYRSSEGKTGDAVWGTRGRWTSLTGKVGDEDITLIMLDHPGNPGFPTYWHARGYGLFAANPLGESVFSNGQEKLNFTILPGQSATFRYCLLIVDGQVGPSQVEACYRLFVKQVK
jgi:hypothetical protein